MSMSSSQSHFEAIAAVASAVASLQQRLQHDDGLDDLGLAATMTIAMQSQSKGEVQDHPCNCDKDRCLTVIRLPGPGPGDSSPCSGSGEVLLVAKYLLMILKKRGMLNELCCECAPRAPPKETAAASASSASVPSASAPVRDADEDDDGAELEVEALHEPQNVEQIEEHEDDESLEDEDDEEAEETDGEIVHHYYDFDEVQRRVTLDLSSLSGEGPQNMTTAKVSLLAPHMLRPVRKLINLYCDVDSAWVLQLLYDLAPQLEELQMTMPSHAHLEVMETMPQLSRLHVEYYDDGSRKTFGKLPDTKTGSKFYIFKRPPARHCGLRFLKVGHMPKKNTFSLIRAHRSTLEELWLTVGTGNPPGSPGMPQDNYWPESCYDLHMKLVRYAGEWPLKRLVLFRWLYVHNQDACVDQIHALRQVLPGVVVLCYVCDKISGSNF